MSQETEICKLAPAAWGREAPQNADAAQILRNLLERAREGGQESDSSGQLPISNRLLMGDEKEKEDITKTREGEEAVIEVAPTAIEWSEQYEERQRHFQRLINSAPAPPPRPRTATGLPGSLEFTPPQPPITLGDLGPADIVRIATHSAFKVIIDHRFRSEFDMYASPPMNLAHPIIDTRRSSHFSVILNNLRPQDSYKAKAAIAALCRMPVSQVIMQGPRVNTPLWEKRGKPLKPRDVEREFPEKISFQYQVKVKANWDLLTSMPAYLNLTTWREWNCLVTAVEQSTITKLQIEALGVFLGEENFIRMNYETFRHPSPKIVYLERPSMKPDPKVCGFHELTGLEYGTEMRESERQEGKMPRLYQ